MKRILILLTACILLVSCQTVPSVDESVDTVIAGKDLEHTISDIKVITDTAKDNGFVMPQKEIVKVIEYVDKADKQVIDLNKNILSLTEKTNKLNDSLIKAEKKVLKRGNVIVILSAMLALISVCVIIYIARKLKVFL